MKEYSQSINELSTDEKRILLKKLLKEKVEKEASFSYPVIVSDPENRYEPFPLTDIQYAYWIGRTGIFELGSVGTHIYVEFDTPVLDIKNLNLAWQRLIERHEMLHAIVLPEGLQKILKEIPFYEIELTDLHELSAGEIGKRLEANRQLMSHKIFKPGEWPLFDIKSFLTGENKIRHCISFDLLFVDLMSFQVLLKEWFQLYQYPNVLLEPLNISFRDYVLAENKLKDFDIYQKSKDYWFKRLATLPPSPELTIVRSPASLKQYIFLRRHSKLDSRRWKQLKIKSQALGLTPASVLLAAFAEILGLWSKNPRFTLNLIIFNRLPLHAQINNIVGDFTSVNLLEIDGTAEDTFVDRARRLQKQLWNDLEHRYISGVEVLRELARINGWSRALMPVVFTCDIVQGFTSSKETFSSQIPVDYADGISQTPQIYLDHQVFEDNGALTVNWDAVDELFPEGLLQEMFEANLHLLRQLADEDDIWNKSNLQLIPEKQLDQRATINATAHPVPNVLLQDMFSEQVLKQPGHQCLITSATSFTYKEIYSRSNHVGHLLRKLGAIPNTLVAVVMDKGWEQVVGVLGILYAGAGYLPISPDNPKDRIWYLLENGKVELVLTQSWLEKNLEWPAHIKCISIDEEELSILADMPLYQVQKQDDLAYVIYTSGSTGTPKGVMIDHKGAVNTIIDINQRFEIKNGDKIFAVSSLSFDLSVYDIFGTLAAGGTIVVPAPNSMQDPSHWVDLMNREKVTIWNSAPALMSMLVEYVQGQGINLPGHLRCVLLSGDWIPVRLPDKIRSLAENATVISLGGATEASIWSILFPIEEVDTQWDSIPYGRPMINQQFHVLNAKLQSCPVWVPGLLCIGGKGLAKGYWKDEEKTMSKFFIHPHTGERLYNTGDIGYYLPDGNIKLLGREDAQVKIRGHRIEPGEIEFNLEQYPGVKYAFTKVVGEKTGNKRLYAYVAPEENNESALFNIESVEPAAHLSMMEAVKQAGKRRSEDTPEDFEQLPDLIHSLNGISTAYICNALTTMGAYNTVGEIYSVESMTDQFNIQPKYQKLVTQWLSELEKDGLLVKNMQHFFSNIQPLPKHSFENLWEDIKRFNGLTESKSELLSYVKYSGENLISILTGERNPLEIFFKDGSSATAEKLYQFNPVAEYINLLAKDILKTIIKNRPSKKTVNILEVGGGTGSTTASLLPVLQFEKCRYVFTDISLFFLSPAKEKFKNYDFISYGLFNIDEEPQSQGYDLHNFDIIIGANVLHDARNLNTSLGYIRSLLVPGGTLILIEGTQNMRLQMITIGLLEGLANFEDDRAYQNLPFLSINQWRNALDSSDFNGFDHFPTSDSSLEALKVHVIVSSAPLSLRHFKKKEILYFLKQKLPEYMIPSDLIYLNSLPLTSNGKINREALQVPNEQMSGYQKAFIAPRNQTEQMLADLWIEALNVDKIGIHDNFFELGGDSLIGIQLISKANKIGLNLNPAELFQYQTIAELALVLEKFQSGISGEKNSHGELNLSSSSVLVKIQPNGVNPPFFCIHPSTGNIECYFALSVQLGREQPVYGLQSLCLIKKQGFYMSVNEMASLYLGLIKEVQPEGPYRIGGWSSGGMIAYEMAQQLLTQGQEVSLLALIDLGTEDYLYDGEDQTGYFNNLIKKFGIVLPEEFYEIETEEEQFNFLLERPEFDQFLPGHLNISEIGYYLETSKENIRAMQNYKLRRYPGKISIFNSEKRKEGTSADPYLGWEQFAGKGVDLTWIPGDHFSMLHKPNVSVLARHLRSVLF